MNRTARSASEAALSRREFLQRASRTVAGTAAALALGSEAVEAAPAAGLRTLGRTGFKVTPITFGGIQMNDRRLLDVAIDQGIPLVHTAPGYQGGKSISAFGEVMKTKRDKVVLAVKVLPSQVDAALKTLNTDHIDIAIPDHNTATAPFPNDDLRAAYEACKKAGKIRFTGFATHKQETTVLRNAIDTGYFDVMLVSYSLLNREELDPLLREAKRKHNMGFMAMKSSRGVKAAPGQRKPDPAMYAAAMKTLLQNRDVDTLLVGMGTFEELQNNLATLRQKLTRAEREMLETHLRQTRASACTGCGNCEVCPKGIMVADVMRCEHYMARGEDDLARETYQSLPVLASACSDCGACTAACPKRLSVSERIRQVHAALA